MKLKQIISRRAHEKFQYWDIVTEWENIIADVLQLPVINEPDWFGKSYVKGIPFLYRWMTKGRDSFCFQLASEIASGRLKEWQARMGLRNKNIPYVVPCIIDFWVPLADLPVFNRIYSQNQVVLVSSREAYVFLKEHQTPVNVVHWPLSLPDQYRFSVACLQNKRYDMALMGRQSPLLEEFLSTYVKEHPDFTYAFKKFEEGHCKYFLSDGHYIGNADTREEYMDIIKGARCALYATPGLCGKSDSNGYNQVTPRFLELLAGGCHVVAQYPDNPDTRFFELEKFSKSIETYEEFEKALTKALTTDVDAEMYEQYLAKHYTSVRAKELAELLNKE